MSFALSARWSSSKALPASVAFGERVPRQRSLDLVARQNVEREAEFLGHFILPLLDQATWIEGIKYLLADYQFGNGRPWPHYRGEDQIWA